MPANGNGSLPRARGFRVQLSPEFNRRCSCGTRIDYSHAYDAEFCRLCDRWLADSCGDRGCEFCAKRPARPSLAADLDPAERIPFNPPRFKAARGSQPKPPCRLSRATDKFAEGSGKQRSGDCHQRLARFPVRLPELEQYAIPKSQPPSSAAVEVNRKRSYTSSSYHKRAHPPPRA